MASSFDLLAVEVELAEAEVAVAMLSAGIPLNARRDPFPHELRAPVNLSTIRDRLDGGIAELVAALTVAWRRLAELLAGWLLAGNPSPAEVISRLNGLLLGRPPNGVEAELNVLQQRVQDRLAAIAAGALEDTRLEADQLDVDFEDPDEEPVDVAVTGQTSRLRAAPWLWLVTAFRNAAQRGAIRPDLTAAGLVSRLLAEVEGASTAGLSDQASQAVNVAQGAGRTAGLGGWRGAPGQQIVAYASEILDVSTCDPCQAVDGTAYSSMDEALGDYAQGQYVFCNGGPRCRGQLVVTVQGSPLDQRIDAGA